MVLFSWGVFRADIEAVLSLKSGYPSAEASYFDYLAASVMVIQSVPPWLVLSLWLM